MNVALAPTSTNGVMTADDALERLSFIHLHSVRADRMRQNESAGVNSFRIEISVIFVRRPKSRKRTANASARSAWQDRSQSSSPVARLGSRRGCWRRRGRCRRQANSSVAVSWSAVVPAWASARTTAAARLVPARPLADFQMLAAVDGKCPMSAGATLSPATQGLPKRGLGVSMSWGRGTRVPPARRKTQEQGNSERKVEERDTKPVYYRKQSRLKSA